MRIGFPVESTNENWLHSSLVAMVSEIHRALDSNQTSRDWLESVPDAKKGLLRTRTALKAKLDRYQRVASRLSAANRAGVLAMLSAQNRISEILACTVDCGTVLELPKTVRKPIKELFESAYDLLGNLHIRDGQYRIIWDAVPNHICPFCFDEHFDHPSLPRTDLDHFLLRSEYPFAAANLRNLVPMGKKCNQSYKGTTNMLFDKSGNRRKCFDPYVPREIDFNLVNSVPFGGSDGVTPRWQIDFDPYSDECNTWDSVFKVRERFEKNILNPHFNEWLGMFARWFVRVKGAQNVSDLLISSALKEFGENEANGGPSARDFLKVRVFNMLYEHCVRANSRLLNHLRDVIGKAVVPV